MVHQQSRHPVRRELVGLKEAAWLMLVFVEPAWVLERVTASDHSLWTPPFRLPHWLIPLLVLSAVAEARTEYL